MEALQTVAAIGIGLVGAKMLIGGAESIASRPAGVGDVVLGKPQMDYSGGKAHFTVTVFPQMTDNTPVKLYLGIAAIVRLPNSELGGAGGAHNTDKHELNFVPAENNELVIPPGKPYVFTTSYAMNKQEYENVKYGGIEATQLIAAAWTDFVVNGGLVEMSPPAIDRQITEFNA